MEIEAYGIDIKQYQFVQAYIRTHNAGDAAEKAGYKRHVGTALLSRPNIQDAVSALATELEQEGIMSAKESLRELSDIAKSGMQDVYNYHKDGTITLKPITEDVAKNIQQLDLTADGQIKTIKMYSRADAVRDLNKIHGAFVTKHIHTGPNGAPIQVEHQYENMDDLMLKMDEIIAKRPKQADVIDVEAAND